MDVGDGAMVGIGISVGEDGAAGRAAAICFTGLRADAAAAGPASSSSSTADVGEGTAVGTGISVGDDGAPRFFAFLAPGAGLACSSAGEVGAATIDGTGIPIVGDEGAARLPTTSCTGRLGLVVAICSSSSSLSEAIGEVGDGTAVGTGISVGDEGAATCAGGCGISRGSTCSSASRGAGDVAAGTSNGTATVGDDGAARPFATARLGGFTV